MEEINELLKCSSCKGKKLKKFFSIKETTGIYFKCCNGCRLRSHENRRSKKKV